MMKYILVLATALLIISCKQELPQGKATSIQATPARVETLEEMELTKQFKDYWYSGTAEISSYELSQARYGEMRSGKAVLIYVTEPFNSVDQVKADVPTDKNRPVMKLNFTRNFNTGIYPYSIMSSTFLPLDKKDNALKVASSIQEWCGHTYMQLNQDDDAYDVNLYSYFQSEGEKHFEVENVMTENQIPIQLRLDPRKMPTGAMKVIPSAEYLRLKHEETKAYDAIGNLKEIEDGLLYSVRFSELDRTIAFKTQKEFPFKILAWMDRYKDGGQPMVSTGTLINTLKTPYWSQNEIKDEVLRDTLQL